jgi:hypothetical protein
VWTSALWYRFLFIPKLGGAQLAPRGFQQAAWSNKFVKVRLNQSSIVFSSL